MTFGYSLSSEAVFRYETIEEMKEAVTKVIDIFHRAFQKLLKRYKCIVAGGDYFEGDKSFMCVRKSLETYLMSLVNYNCGGVIINK